MARASLGQQWWSARAVQVAAALPVIVAVIFRFYHLRTLPPGLSPAEANLGLAAAAFAHHGIWPHFTSNDSYSPLLTVLDGAVIKLVGIKVTALRLIPALIGSATVYVAFLWARSWFDRRVGWITAFLVAVSPWAITMSRGAVPTVLGPFILLLLLWLGAHIVRNPSSRPALFGLIATVIVALLAGPWGWFALVITSLLALAASITTYRKPLMGLSSTKRLILIGVKLAVIAAILVSGFLLHRSASLKADFHLASLGHIGKMLGSSLGQFYLHGDDDFTHNLGGAPLLNAFVGLMVVAGLMVTLSRTVRHRERYVLGLLVLTLVPDIFSSLGGANAARAAAVLPVAALLAAIGVAYLLDLWSSTFPINSAARSVGRGVMALLLGLTMLQGYTQYFTAWANSTPTYAAYDRSSTQSAAYANTHKTTETTYIVVTATERPASDYVTYGRANVHVILPADTAALPTNAALRIVSSVDARALLVPLLRTHLPGGTLKPHYDTDGSELFYSYEAAAQ